MFNREIKVQQSAQSTIKIWQAYNNFSYTVQLKNATVSKITQKEVRYVKQRYQLPCQNIDSYSANERQRKGNLYAEAEENVVWN